MTVSTSHISGEIAQALTATCRYPYRTPPAATSSQANAQRRVLSK